MIKELRKLNLALIKENENNQEELKKQLLIQKLLENDRCFFEVDIETSYSILKDLHIPDNHLKDVYCNLIDIKNYK